jgi:pentatricopeptide repeat protein
MRHRPGIPPAYFDAVSGRYASKNLHLVYNVLLRGLALGGRFDEFLMLWYDIKGTSTKVLNDMQTTLYWTIDLIRF